MMTALAFEYAQKQLATVPDNIPLYALNEYEKSTLRSIDISPCVFNEQLEQLQPCMHNSDDELLGGSRHRKNKKGGMPCRSIAPEPQRIQQHAQLPRRQAWVENVPSKDVIENVLHPSIFSAIIAQVEEDRNTIEALSLVSKCMSKQVYSYFANIKQAQQPPGQEAPATPQPKEQQIRPLPTMHNIKDAINFLYELDEQTHRTTSPVPKELEEMINDETKAKVNTLLASFSAERVWLPILKSLCRNEYVKFQGQYKNDTDEKWIYYTIMIHGKDDPFTRSQKLKQSIRHLVIMETEKRCQKSVTIVTGRKDGTLKQYVIIGDPNVFVNNNRGINTYDPTGYKLLDTIIVGVDTYIGRASNILFESTMLLLHEFNTIQALDANLGEDNNAGWTAVARKFLLESNFWNTNNKNVGRFEVVYDTSGNPNYKDLTNGTKCLTLDDIDQLMSGNHHVHRTTKVKLFQKYVSVFVPRISNKYLTATKDILKKKDSNVDTIRQIIRYKLLKEAYIKYNTDKSNKSILQKQAAIEQAIVHKAAFDNIELLIPVTITNFVIKDVTDKNKFFANKADYVHKHILYLQRILTTHFAKYSKIYSLFLCNNEMKERLTTNFKMFSNVTYSSFSIDDWGQFLEKISPYALLTDPKKYEACKLRYVHSIFDDMPSNDENFFFRKRAFATLAAFTEESYNTSLEERFKKFRDSIVVDVDLGKLSNQQSQFATLMKNYERAHYNLVIDRCIPFVLTNPATKDNPDTKDNPTFVVDGGKQQVTFDINDITATNAKPNILYRYGAKTPELMKKYHEDYMTAADEIDKNYLAEVNSFFTVPVGAKGGARSIKKLVLGRMRTIYKDGRKSYVIYKKQKIPLAEARALEKTMKKK